MVPPTFQCPIGANWRKVLTEHAGLAVSGFKLTLRPGIFTELDLHKMDVALIGWELTGVLDSGQRLIGWCWC